MNFHFLCQRNVMHTQYELLCSCVGDAEPCLREVVGILLKAFHAVASVESSLSETGTGRTHPGGRRCSAEKLGEKWTNAMGLPPLSGCLWDSPSQPGKSSLMIVVAEDQRGGVQEPSCMFLLGCLVSLFSQRVGHIQVTWWSSICYINTDLHSPQSTRINFVQ